MDIVKKTVTLTVALDDDDLIDFAEKQPDFEAWVKNQMVVAIEKDKPFPFQKAERLMICDGADNSGIWGDKFLYVLIGICMVGVLLMGVNGK